MSPSVSRTWLAGALTLPVLALALTAATALYWPEVAGVRTFARIADSLAPHLLVMAAIGSLGLLLIGARRAGLLALLVVLAGAGGLVQRHVTQSQPPGTGVQADLTVLWFNVLSTNPTPPGDLAAALESSGADLVILGEAKPLRGQMDALARTFPRQAGCRNPRCEVMVLARDPDATVAVQRMGRADEERLATVTLQWPGRAPLSVLGLHMIKPWFFGFAEADQTDALAALQGQSGPLLVVGDFNAAPWSRRVQELIGFCGLAPARRPVPTWPAKARALGVPIDLMLTRDGAQMVSLAPWGEGLGSNHRGLIARVALPDTAPPAPNRPDCVRRR